jgi:hypothetical protein
MAAHPASLKRALSGPLNGVALALYFALLPYVVTVKWSASSHQSNAVLVRGLLIALGCIWVIFLVQLIGNVRRVRHGGRVGAGGSVWLATLIVAALPYLVSAPHLAPRRDTAAVSNTLGVSHPHSGSSAPSPGAHRAMSAIPLALAARRRRDDLRRGGDEPDDLQIDDTIELLRNLDPRLVEVVRRATATRRDGVVRLDADASAGDAPEDPSPVVVCVVRDEPGGATIAFAREGGVLRVPIEWSALDVSESAVGLHDGGRVAFTRTENELLRALATRSLRHTLVVHVGAASSLDEDLRACCVTLAPVAIDQRAASRGSERHHFVAPATGPDEGASVRVELLRADPRVTGLVEPFTATLRRRCIEMTAYLALHRHEPVTGDRLRTRVLTRADVDASLRTLANTASSVRRSLGVDARGPRLHPVTSSGLYVTHGLASDVELLHALVARARTLALSEAAPLAERALALVQGEPLASALRGYEWFLAEGFTARLQRDAEWAALALHQYALEAEDYEAAFWAISQGRLVDPYSDALADALRRVPRLRQFGRDGAGRAQHEAVGAGGAVAMGRPLAGLGE